MNKKKVIGFCQECGIEFNSEDQVYLVSFTSPAGLMGDLMGNGTTKIKLCETDYDHFFMDVKSRIRRGASK